MPKNRGNNFTIVTAIVIVSLFLYFSSTSSIQVSNSKPTFVKDEGRVVFAVTDLAVNIDNITSVNITIDSILIHSTMNDSWINTSAPQKSVNLLQLQSINELLYEYYLPEGNYNQVRLDISNVVVTDWTFGNKKAKLPSSTLKFNIDLAVKEGETSSILFDFLVDKSLHVTGTGNSGVYIMAPVIKLTVKEKATVEVTDGKVNIYGGTIKTEVEAGMDERGNFGPGRNIDPNKKMFIQSGMLITY